MPKLLASNKPAPSLPAQEIRLLLPPPGLFFWPFIVLAAVPIAFVAAFALSPQMRLSDQVMSGIIAGTIGLFLVGVALLVVTTVQLCYDVVKLRRAAMARHESRLKLTLLFLLSVLFLPVLAYLIQPW
ncbi:MAG: hypothetical protein PHY34_03440 [Patescibacteria group bacterium]|nr:hypothetical protein [Patescibacteria group bacterium]MDD5715663.1 hypothetical protein [Patescibacteria group bacterium]